jgi:mono/diheme cytochrome c family protein
MRAAEEQNEEEFFQAGAQIYSVCSACHQGYSPDIVNRFTDDD